MAKMTTNSGRGDWLGTIWQDRKRFLLTPLCSLLILCGFALTWLLTPGTSGWDMALNVASKDLVLLPGLAPEALLSLWLVPCAALLLFSSGMVRLFGKHSRWMCAWALYLAVVCLGLMISFCFPLFPPDPLRYLRDGNLQTGFWLTSLALLFAALGLLFPDPIQQAMEAKWQTVLDLSGRRVSRRRTLSNIVHVLGFLAVGGTVGLDLGWLIQPRIIRRQAFSLDMFQASTLDGARKLVWSPDATSLYECLSGSLRRLKIEGGQIARTYAIPASSTDSALGNSEKSFNNMALSADGRWVAAAVNVNGVSIWEAVSGKLEQRFAPNEQDAELDKFYGGVAWSPDGSSLATSKFVTENQAELFILRASDLKQLASYPLSIPARTLAWSNDGRLLAVITNRVDVWDMIDNQKIWTYQPPNYSILSETERFRMDVIDVAWSSDSRRLAISLRAGLSSDGFEGQPCPVLIWDIIEKRQVLECQGHWGSANGLTWSPDGTRIAAAGSNWTVQVWNAHTGARLLTYQGHRGTVWSVAWSPDGNWLASGSTDQTIQIWEAPGI